MARPRLHPLDDLMDVAEELVTEGGPSGLTLRELAARAGASNGAIYHAFSSKDELLARLWLRAAARLGALMDEAVAANDDPLERVVAVALAPAVLARRHRTSAQLFFGQRPDRLVTADLDPALGATLAEQRERFAALLVALADQVWGRHDRVALDAITTCVVDLPGGLLQRRLLRSGSLGEATERRIEAAVRAVLDLPLGPA
jgi:AcrR family transcriptional regulator